MRGATSELLDADWPVTFFLSTMMMLTMVMISNCLKLDGLLPAVV
jgi:hypothetical protein